MMSSRALRSAQSLVFQVVYCRSLFVLFLLATVYCLFFFDLQLLVAPLVSAYCSCGLITLRLLPLAWTASSRTIIIFLTSILPEAIRCLMGNCELLNVMFAKTLSVYQQYILYYPAISKSKNNFQTVCKQLKQASFSSFSMVSSVTSAQQCCRFFLSLYTNQVLEMLYQVHDLITLKFI